jgi:hypothetical protein
MAIDRAPWNALVDDDGSNLVGTVWNKDKIKTVILDPVDAAFQTPASGAWAPVDRSGAGIVFTVHGARYWKQDKFVAIQASLNFPVTANGLRIEIGDLPFINAPFASGLYVTSCAQMVQIYIQPSGNRLFVNSSTGGVLTNANLSGGLLNFSGVYLTA